MGGLLGKKKSYKKPPITYKQQADQLISRGLKANRDELVKILSRVNYYRLSGYLFFFREKSKEQLSNDTNIEKVLHVYKFDAELRKLLLYPLEEIEVKLRTELAYYLGHQYGPFGYVDKTNFNLNPNSVKGKYKKKAIRRQYKHYETMLKSLKRIMKKDDKEDFINHFRDNYKQKLPAIWMVVELFSFGMLVTMFKSMKMQDAVKFSNYLNIPIKVFISWMMSLNVFRNICAHYGRLWKRTTGGFPKIPRGSKYKEWKDIKSDMISFPIITIIHYLCCKYNLDRDWERKMKQLFKSSNIVLYSDYGFPDNWEDSPIWQIDNEES